MHMTCDGQKPHPLLLAIKHINEDLSDAAVVLITTIETEDGRSLSTTTEVMQSAAQSDATLEFVDQYAYKLIDKQKGILEPQRMYKFTIVEYLPQTKALGRQLYGEVYTKSVH